MARALSIRLRRDAMWRSVSDLKRFGFIFALLITALIAGTLIYFFSPPALTSAPCPTKDNLKYEFVKFLIQLLVIVIFGGILIQEYNRRRDRKEAFNDLRKTLLANLINSYFKVKKARRILDANIVPKAGTHVKEISWEVYEEQMKEIISAQLEFENHNYQLHTFPYTFSKRSIQFLRSYADVMETYLKQSIDEYQGLNIPIANQTQPIATSQLPKLGDMIDTNKFNKGFSNYFHSSIELIQEQILRI